MRDQLDRKLTRAQDVPFGAPVIAFDLDGTLCNNGPKINYQNGQTVKEQCRPRPFAIQRLRALWASGTCHIAVVTARNWNLSGVTHDQLRDWVGDEVFASLDVCFSDLPPLDSIPATMWYEWLLRYKARELRALDAVCYIGDTSHDAKAASDAGCDFLGAYQFSRGDRIPGLQPVSVAGA